MLHHGVDGLGREDVPRLEAVLRDPRDEIHTRLATELWNSESDADAVERFEAVGVEIPPISASAESLEIKTSNG